MTETMTSKQRVRAAFSRQPVDRVPMMILEGGTWLVDSQETSFEELYSRRDLGAQDIVAVFDKFCSDSVTVPVGGWQAWLSAFGCPVDMAKIGMAADVGHCIHDLEADIAKLDKSTIRSTLEGNTLVQKMMRQIREVKTLVNGQKYLAAPLLGPFSAASVMVGTGVFMKMLSKKPSELAKLLDFTASACAEFANMMVENGVEILEPCDPVSSGDLISPAMFSGIAAPAFEAFAAQLKGHEILVLHICGKTATRVPQLRHFKWVDGFSFDSMNDLKIMMELAGNDIALLGNLATVEDMLMGTEENAYQQSYKKATIAGLGGGYIMMPGCELPARSPLVNVLAMTRAATDYAAAQA